MSEHAELPKSRDTNSESNTLLPDLENQDEFLASTSQTATDEYYEKLEKLVDSGRYSYDDARRILGEAPDAVVDGVAEAGPSVGIKQYYQEELALISLVSAMNKRNGLKIASEYDKDLHERYGDNLSNVVDGASRRAQEDNYRFSQIFRERELIEAGFDEDDVALELISMKRHLRDRFTGPQNTRHRENRRREIERKLKDL